MVFMISLLAGILLSSCTGTKFLSANETLYTGAEIQFENGGRKGSIRNMLEPEIRPEPNMTILGMRPALWFYFIAGDVEKDKGFRFWLKYKLGEPPVLMSDVDPGRIANVLQGTLFNNGYFNATVDEAVVPRGNKKAKVVYTVSAHPPFRLREIMYPQPRDSIYKAVVEEVKEGSTLKSGQRYDLQQLQLEMDRIEQVLENHGFFYFDDRHIIFEADTTVGNRQVDIYATLEETVPDRAKRIYRLNKINVFTDYTLTVDSSKITADTLHINGYNYVDHSDSFRPAIITNAINLRKGDIYTSTAHDYTLNHLMNLGVFKFVNIKYDEAVNDSATLNASIYLTPLEKKSIRLELQAVSKSNNFVGPGVSVAFTNRNFLRGAERFELSVNSAYEVQISSQQAGPLNSLTLGIESSLTVPRFISPFRISYYNSQYIPNTRFGLGYNLQRRINFFQLSSFNVEYGYTWRETTAINHELYVADITFVRLARTSREFQQLLERNPVLENSVQDQFIIGTRYSYTLNTQLKEEGVDIFGQRTTSKHNFYLNGNVGLSGNLMHFLQQSFDNGEEELPYELFGAPYSQYVLADVDFRHYWQIDKHNKLASRIMVGAGYPYGNSTTLPYIKQYAAGGSNSIRAFPARSLGPGTYNIREDSDIDVQTLFIDQRGDIKVEANLELRFDIIKALKGAIFTDAGNIWLWRPDAERPGGKFEWNNFISEVAVGTGAGLRFDFNFFVLRFDVAFPVRKPWLEDRWVFDEIDFGSKTWRRQNLVYNIAIGYPF